MADPFDSLVQQGRTKLGGQFGVLSGATTLSRTASWGVPNSNQQYPQQQHPQPQYPQPPKPQHPHQSPLNHNHGAMFHAGGGVPVQYSGGALPQAAAGVLPNNAHLHRAPTSWGDAAAAATAGPPAAGGAFGWPAAVVPVAHQVSPLLQQGNGGSVVSSGVNGGAEWTPSAEQLGVYESMFASASAGSAVVGTVSGRAAVQFFSRSGLPKGSLKLVRGGGGRHCLHNK